MGWYPEDTSFCDKIIELHKTSPDKRPGVFGTSRLYNTNIKESYDLMWQPDEIPDYYREWIFKCLEQYLKKYEYAELTTGIDIIEQAQVQFYPPNGGYKLWHMERSGLDWPIATRYLVYMTYLNTVEDGGGTEFYYQGVKTKAEKGLTLLWPTDWPWTHRGEVSPTENKYVVTGWFGIKTIPKGQK